MKSMRYGLVFVAVAGALPMMASDVKDIDASRKALYETVDRFNAIVASKAELPEITALYHDSLERIDRLKDLPKNERTDVRRAIEETYKQVKKLHDVVAHFHKGSDRDKLSDAVAEMEKRWEKAHQEMAKLDRVPQERKNAADDEMINALKIMQNYLATREGEQEAPVQRVRQVEHKRVVAKESAKLVPSAPKHPAATVAVPLEEKKEKAAEAAARRAQASKEKTKLKKGKGSKEMYPGLE